MEEEVLEKLLTKLIGLTEFGALRWHFAGDVSKAFVTVYKNARLKLTGQMIDITESEGDTVRIDPRLHEPVLSSLISSLEKAARESATRFRTGRVQAVTPSSLINTCKRLLDDEETGAPRNCLVCARQFDPNKKQGALALENPATGKSFHMCDGCVAKLGVAVAQEWLSAAAGGKTSQVGAPIDPNMEDVFSSDTLSDAGAESPAEPARNAIRSSKRDEE
jgi:hypothetical protein